jgi:hypothetical protein
MSPWPRLSPPFMPSNSIRSMIQRETLRSQNQRINPLGPLWLKTTNIPADVIHKVLATVSFTLDSIESVAAPKGYADFKYLRDHPYFCHQGNYYCLDYEFGLGKLESGVIWRVLDALEEIEFRSLRTRGGA